jgi:hypothetical protein
MKKKRTTIKRGQLFKVPRKGKPAAFVRVVGVRWGQQPKVTLRRVTRSGGRRSGETDFRHWLQFVSGVWRLPENWTFQKPQCQ